MGRDLHQNDYQPLDRGVLQRKLVDLIGVALNSGGTNLNPDGMRRHIKTALQAGVSREEILLVLKMASVVSFDACMLATPLLLEEAWARAKRVFRGKCFEMMVARDGVEPPTPAFSELG